MSVVASAVGVYARRYFGAEGTAMRGKAMRPAPSQPGGGRFPAGGTSSRTIHREKNVVTISALPNLRLHHGLDVIVEPDDGGFTASSVDLPLYGYGDSAWEAVESLKREVESLYEDLMEDDNFAEEWLRRKEFLRSIVVPA